MGTNSSNILESIASSLLTKYLGDYIEGLDKEHLSIALEAGDVTLGPLRFKKEALSELNLPITIKEGVLGKLKLQIPWKSLKSKPTVVQVDQLYLLISPQTNILDAKFEDRAQKTKQSRLQLYELTKESPEE